MSNDFDGSRKSDGVIAKKGSSGIFLFFGILMILMGAFFLIGTIIRKEYGLIFASAFMLTAGIILVIVFLYYRGQPKVMIKQIGDELEIYDPENKRYHRVALAKILNIEGTKHNPNVPSVKGYLTFLTTEGTLKTGMLEDYEASKQCILSLKSNSLSAQEMDADIL